MLENLVLSPATKEILEAEDEGSSPAELGRITQRVLELEHEIRLLKTHHNAKLPIGRLPSEVLCTIFIHMASVEEQRRDVRSIFGLGQVCRRWRGTALDCAELWTELSFDNPTAVIETMIARSRGAPLSVHYCQGTTSSVDLLFKVVRDTHRLRVVDLESSQNGLTDILAKFATTAPALEHLALIAFREGLSMNDFLVLPPKFLKGGAPSLKRLELMTASCLPWADIPLFAGITDLTLAATGQFNALADRPTPSSFLLSLGTMPHLQTISLIGYLPNFAETSVAVACPPFKALKILTLDDFIDIISSTLHAIRLPHSAVLELVILGEVGLEAISIPHFLRSLKALQCENQTSWVGKAEVLNIQVDIEENGSGYNPIARLFLAEDAGPPSGPHLNLSFDAPDAQRRMSLMLRTLNFMSQCEWNFSTTTSLELLGVSGRIPLQSFLYLFSTQCPNLRRMTFRNCNSAFIQFLCILGSAQAQVSPPFPALTLVECFDITFLPNEQVVDIVFAMFRTRAMRFATPDLQLHFERCTPLDWPHLKNYVQEIPARVVCDGYSTYEEYRASTHTTT